MPTTYLFNKKIPAGALALCTLLPCVRACMDNWPDFVESKLSNLVTILFF